MEIPKISVFINAPTSNLKWSAVVNKKINFVHLSFKKLIISILFFVSFFAQQQSTYAARGKNSLDSKISPLCVTQLQQNGGAIFGNSFVAALPENFLAVLVNTRHSKHPDRVWIRSLSDYQNFVKLGGRLFLSTNGAAGFGVGHDGELISLFNNSNEKGLGSKAMQFAIEVGADHLHCWGESLVRYYGRFGFKVKQVTPWKEDYWVSDDIPPDPKPHLYLMRLE